MPSASSGGPSTREAVVRCALHRAAFGSMGSYRPGASPALRPVTDYGPYALAAASGLRERLAGVTAGATRTKETEQRERLRRTRHLLREARGHLTRRALRLIGFVVFAYLVLKLVPGLEKALEDLKSVSAKWVIGAMVVETASEIGYVFSWRGILDPDDLLRQDGRGKHLGARVAWAQLGGGMIVPGGTLGSMGVGAWMLHRLGLPMDRVAERQFTLMFLNTAVDALAIVFFGLGLAVGVFSGEGSLSLTLLPAASSS